MGGGGGGGGGGVLPLNGLIKLPMHPVNPLSGNVPYFIILHCLMPGNFTHQGESVAIQWVN
jgi:hypothetical protein